MLLLWTLFTTGQLRPAGACAGSGVGRDSEIITDPTFSFEVSPPVRWTYFPIAPETTGQTIANYFPGQSDSSQQATQACQNDVMAAYLEALADANLAFTGSNLGTTVSYSPDEISNCYVGQPIPAGTRIGYLAGGAITQVALVTGQGGAQTTVSNCPLSETTINVGVTPYQNYQKPVSVTTRGGVTLPRYLWERIANSMQSILNFRYNALFRSPIEIS